MGGADPDCRASWATAVARCCRLFLLSRLPALVTVSEEAGKLSNRRMISGDRTRVRESRRD